MRIPLAFALLLACIASSDAQAPGDSAFRALDAYLRSELGRLRVPGAAVVVVRGDSLMYGATFGRGGESARAVTLETPFAIGSISKSITALAVMQLVDDRRVALDSSVTTYLPWFHPIGEGSATVTIRQLLNQNSGIPDYAGRMDWARPDSTDAALERHARRLATVKLAHPPGTMFEYANANYVLLGAVIQEVSHSSYERFIEERVFGPLAMKHSFASPTVAERNEQANGYRLWFGHPIARATTTFMRGNAPAGELMASAGDVARYERAPERRTISRRNDCVVDGSGAIAPAGVSTRHTLVLRNGVDVGNDWPRDCAVAQRACTGLLRLHRPSSGAQ